LVCRAALNGTEVKDKSGTISNPRIRRSAPVILRRLEQPAPTGVEGKPLDSMCRTGSGREQDMGEETTSLGGIHISPNAVAAIAYHATLQSYGVVGLAPKNFAEGVALTITREPARGVSVRFDGENIDIDLYIIVEYGTRITTVADSVANSVRFNVEKALGMPIHEVNVHVAGLRVSNSD
jgi:uncharacterized alkaline shock family protein YloU